MHTKKIMSICILAAALSGCNTPEERALEKPGDHIVRLGVTDYVTPNLEGFEAIGIQYQGMIHPLTFQLYGGNAEPAASYRSTSSKIKFHGYHFEILKVDSDSLILRYNVPERAEKKNE